MSALAKCDIIKKGVQDTHKENNDLKRKILELEKQNKQQSREIDLLNDELKIKEEHIKTKAALRSSEDVLSDIISESFRDEFSNDEEEEKGQAHKKQRVTDVKDETMN